MKKYFITIFIILSILFFQSCSIFNFVFKNNNIDNIIMKKKYFNISLEKNKFIASKSFKSNFDIYIGNIHAATPSEIVDNISIYPESKDATIQLYKNSNNLYFYNFTKQGTYTLTFWHSNISTSLSINILPEKPENFHLEVQKNLFLADEVIKIPLNIYYTDKFDNIIYKPIKSITIFPFVKHSFEKRNDKYILKLFSITKPGKYIFSLKINDNITQDISFEIVPNIPSKIKFDKDILNLATHYDDTSHFPPKSSKINFTLLDKFSNETKIQNISYKILSNSFLKPDINIEDNTINITSNVSPGEYNIEFYYNGKKLSGTLKLNILSVPRTIISIDKKLSNNLLYYEFSIQDGNTNSVNNIEITKISIKSSNTKILVGNSLKKYLIKKENSYIINNFPLTKPFSKVEITFYIKSNVFNYIKKITKILY
jgi:hypothetical protein